MSTLLPIVDPGSLYKQTLISGSKSRADCQALNMNLIEDSPVAMQSTSPDIVQPNAVNQPGQNDSPSAPSTSRRLGVGQQNRGISCTQEQKAEARFSVTGLAVLYQDMVCCLEASDVCAVAQSPAS